MTGTGNLPRKSKSIFICFVFSCLLPLAFHLLTFASFAASMNDEPKTIVADKIEYNTKYKSIQTRGQTEITNASGQRMTLTDSYVGPKGFDAAGQNLELLLTPQTMLSAATVTKNGHLTHATDAIYTNCHNCDNFGNAWEISAEELTHNSEGRYIDFENMVFRVYDVPVFWLPFLYNYPDPTVKHKSGLLYPGINSTNGMGTQFNLPLYLSFSERHDMTVIGSYLTQENPLWQIEHRLNTQHAEFRSRGSFTDTKESGARWHVFNNDSVEMGDHVRANLFLQRTSDKTYLQKYGFYNSQPYLDSGAKVEFFQSSGYVTAESHIFQELRSHPGSSAIPSGDILPNIHGVYQMDPLFADTYLLFMGDILGVQNFRNDTAAQRMLGEARLTSPWTLYGNRITGSLAARYDAYNFANTAMLDGTPSFSGLESRVLSSGYIDWSFPLLRTGENWTQTIMPRARITQLSNSGQPAFAISNDSAGALLSDASLFSNNRYSGYDLWQSGTYADYGIYWNAFDDENRSIEVFLGQTYDFSEPVAIDPNSGFHDGASDYVGRLYFDTGGLLALQNRFRFAQDNMSLRHLETNMRFGRRSYIDTGYIWAMQFIDAVTLDKSINEVTAGFGTYLTNRLMLRYNMIYNITDQRFQRQTGGIYYDHPCYSIAFEYIKDSAVKGDYVGKTTVHLQFGLKLGVER